MARVESLGVHIPVALSYLIREGILPPEPKKDLYQWETYVSNDGHGDIDEEVLATRTCVVWSQGKYIRNVYRFELEGEDVKQALLTSFPNASKSATRDVAHAKGVVDGYGRTQGRDRLSLGPRKAKRTSEGPDVTAEAASRALVVFLKTKAHIYFLQGSGHIIDLPFEIERAFPAPRGCILQRRIAPTPALPPTPQLPVAPPNSFFSSQAQPSFSYLQSPTLAKSFRGSQPAKPSPLGGASQLEALFQELLGTATNTNDDETPSLYTLTSPLSDLCVLTYSTQHHKPRLAGKGQAGLSVEFETLDAAEDVIYVSSCDELDERNDQNAGALMLIVTSNRDLQTLTVWHAWYIEEKSLRDLLKQRAAQKAAKARRRSSFLSATMGTGATTPAVRNRDNARESFVGAGTQRLPGETHPPAATAVSSRKTTRQDEEEVMASRMDPDYQPIASQQQPARESRRISSLNTDMRASQNAGAASFAVGGRRNASFGGANDRKSFGHRKSRGSTSGSVFSRSHGPDDDLMELDSSGEFEGEESIESIVRHIRATFEAAGADSVFGSVDDDFSRELVVRKLHSAPIRQHPNAGSDAFKVAIVKNTQPAPDSEDRTLAVYILEQHTKDLKCIKLQVRNRRLFPELTGSVQVAIPVVIDEQRKGRCADLIKLQDSGTTALLLAGEGLLLAGDNSGLCPLPPKASYRVYNPFDTEMLQSLAVEKEVGRNRTLQVPDETLALAHSGAGATFDEVDSLGTYHRRRIRLRPEEDIIDPLLDVCQTVLPQPHAGMVRKVWCLACARLSDHSEGPGSTGSSIEWVALVTTILFFAIKLLDPKAKAALNVSRMAAGKAKAGQDNALHLHKRHLGSDVFSQTPWSWMAQQSPPSQPFSSSPNTSSQLDRRKDQLLPIAAALADELQQSHVVKHVDTPLHSVSNVAIKLMLGIHLYREEQKLSTLPAPRNPHTDVAPVIAQLGSWLGLAAWSFSKGSYYHLEGASEDDWANVKSAPSASPRMPLMDEPIGVFQWFEHAVKQSSAEQYPSLSTLAGLHLDTSLAATFTASAMRLTPRTCALSNMLAETAGLRTTPAVTVELLAKHSLDESVLETLPEAIAAPFREAIARCEREPPTTWSDSLLRLVGREDLLTEAASKVGRSGHHAAAAAARDLQTICHAIEQHSPALKTREVARHTVSSLIFSLDRRLVSAVGLMHWTYTQEAECEKQPDWTDAKHFEIQRRLVDFVTVRMWALPAGDAMIHYDAFTPLLTEKYGLPGFASRCLMHPMEITLDIDRSSLTEEKVGWAYFHAGVSLGLRISRHVKGIDTSWIAFNKPADLTNRHAGLLLALGLGGHLRSLAKWLSFKYLTPKHTMTSVGLLLGLSASYIGTMDSLITRMLSVHITRMLPSGAAELNVSPITQTAGLMGIGLLYYNTQHRRMSEIMLSEIEYMEVEDPDSGPDPLRDESYRLAGGFALGLINLGKGKDLRGLHGMHLPERLLAVAVGPRPVHAVHVFDRATAGAIIAITLVYMKSGDKAMARKIDIPDTEAQYAHVRPDMLLLRTTARHIILWDEMQVDGSQGPNKADWIRANTPACYKGRYLEISNQPGYTPLLTADVPFYNIIAGLAWALGLRYAGSGNTTARDEILIVLAMLYKVRSQDYYYDAKLARATVRRCIDVMALAAATVMAGTGDLETFRYLRRLHGRISEDTPYGSHLAAHLAIGVLFMGGGTYTFSTSNLAVAMLMCAFYPLFPADVHDNRCHLQAFRHFWVFAAEARCLVVEDIDTHRPIKMPVVVTMKDGTQTHLMAPQLLPELESIATVQTEDMAYWRVTLDFAGNPKHLAAFRANQTIYVRRCPATEAHKSAFTATMAALNNTQSTQAVSDLWQSIFSLNALKEMDKADVELIMPPDQHSSTYMDERGTVVDDRLVLSGAAGSNERDKLWNLRMLFAWAERARNEGDGKMRWLGHEVVEALRARVDERARKGGR